MRLGFADTLLFLAVETPSEHAHRPRPKQAPRNASNRQSFHSRDSLYSHIPEYSEGKSPYTVSLNANVSQEK